LPHPQERFPGAPDVSRQDGHYRLRAKVKLDARSPWFPQWRIAYTYHQEKMNTLKPDSLEWSLLHLKLEGDGDLFPKPFEIEVIEQQWLSLKPQLEKIDVSSHVWRPMRTVLVPKDDMSFRRACQLDPIDALIFGAIVFEIGEAIEQKRRPQPEHHVFSYRFSPDNKGALFSQSNPWELFWEAAKERAGKHRLAITVDISDYYNQIYHHTVENQLNTCGVSAVHRTAILNLLKTATDGVSRGIPIGPHASHVLAEMCLSPLDDYLCLRGVDFIRYVDDVHVYCDSIRDGQLIIFDIADFLDRSQKLLLNKQKTRRFSAQEYRQHATMMLLDNPINEAESAILKVIKRRGGGYGRISIKDLAEDELKTCGDVKIEEILNAYLSSGDPDYTRLRWFLRRLCQLGISGGVVFILEHLIQVLPAIGDAAAYLNSASGSYKGEWKSAGTDLLIALEEPIVEKSEYLEIVLLSLFGRITELNHLEDLIKDYDRMRSASKRKVLLAASTSPAAAPWLQTLKAGFGSMDAWQRRAFLYAARQLPRDERKFWFKQVQPTLSSLEKAVVDAVKNL
jgi:hypothetical protein